MEGLWVEDFICFISQAISSALISETSEKKCLRHMVTGIGCRYILRAGNLVVMQLWYIMSGFVFDESRLK